MMTVITQEENVQAFPEFDNHQAVYKLEDTEAGFLGYIAIHRNNKDIASFGATRMWAYESPEEGLRDALRLSKMMSYKAALAGLNCGGAKGVIVADPNGENKEQLLRLYARCVDQLKGAFVTGTDVGLNQEDLSIMVEETPQIVGFNDNSTPFTALGVYESIGACLKKVFGTDSVAERSFAIQGAGKIGRGIIEFLDKAGCRTIYVSEISTKAQEEIRKTFPYVQIVPTEEIHKQKVDVFCPCALSKAITKDNIGELQCKIVVGGANNQLERSALGQVLFDKGILYAPDYVVNAGGLISVFDEYKNPTYNEERVLQKVEEIEDTLEDIFELSDEKALATNTIASQIAEGIFNDF